MSTQQDRLRMAAGEVFGLVADDTTRATVRVLASRDVGELVPTDHLADLVATQLAATDRIASEFSAQGVLSAYGDDIGERLEHHGLVTHQRDETARYVAPTERLHRLDAWLDHAREGLGGRR